MDDDTCRAILAALVDLSDDIKLAAGAAASEHVKRGLIVADQLLHVRARSYAAGLAPMAQVGVDELALARERREMAGLPSISTEVTDGGLEMSLDLGEDPKRKR
jgi:hypothetical protein